MPWHCEADRTGSIFESGRALPVSIWEHPKGRGFVACLWAVLHQFSNLKSSRTASAQGWTTVEQACTMRSGSNLVSVLLLACLLGPEWMQPPKWGPIL